MKTLIYAITLFMVLSIGQTSIYAGITINDDTTIEVSTETRFSIDDDLVDADEFEQEFHGHIATVIADDSNTATEVRANKHIKGPVTSLDPFQVFGQDVVIDDATILINNSGSFALGDLLEVSGHFNTENVFLASRVQSKSSLQHWKLTGHIQQIVGNQISLGHLTFDTTNTLLNDCGQNLSVGELVKIKLLPIADFTTDSVITDISKFECKNSLVDLPDDNGGNFEFEVEGFVSEIIDADNFKINSQQVRVTNNTVYFNGTQADIIAGVKLEAEGNLDSSSNILTANKIKFKNTKVRMEGPVSVGNLNGEQVIIFGISGILTAFTEDKDNLIADGLSSAMNIEARGYVDSSGNFYVEKLRERGDADASDSRLRGPIANLNDQAFTILGVNINTSGSQFFIEDQPVAASTFFTSLSNGNIVDVNHSQYDAETNTLSGGEVTIELEDDSASQLKSSAGIVPTKAAGGLISYGTITAFTKAEAAAPVVIPAPPVSSTSSGGGGSTNLLFMLLLAIGLIARKVK